MKEIPQIIATAKKTLALESEAVAKLMDYIDHDFVETVQQILNCQGRVVITGIGKSANIAQKMVATLNSTGTQALFMHAADAIHGDLGMVQKTDVVICISKSGESPEVKVLVPLVKNLCHSLVAMVGNKHSFLAQHAHYVLDTTVEKEACPNNLAPTCSTTAQLAMGDALAVCLMEARGFSARDFAKYHPGGALGKKLFLKLGDLLHSEKPSVNADADLQSVIMEISSKRLGATAVLDKGKLAGVITDGDLRRMLHNFDNIKLLKAVDIMTKNPISCDSQDLAVSAFELMEKKNITQVIVTQEGEYAGIVHLHDILKEGIY